MAKNCIITACLCVLLSVFGFANGRAGVISSALQDVGVREATGNNDGKRVEEYLRSVGLGKGYAWCAAFVHFHLTKNGVPNTITAWSPTAHNKKGLRWVKGIQYGEIHPGDVFTVWYTKLKRIGHTGFYYRRVSGKVFETIEGNTNGAGSREGDGVYIKKRSLHQIYSITAWITN